MPRSDDMRIGDSNGPIPPTREKGSVVYEPALISSWTELEAMDELETNPKLTFPESIYTYHAMLTDPQVQGLRTGTTWPIMRMLYYIKPNGAPDEMVDKEATDLNLPVAESIKDLQEQREAGTIKQRRTQQRFKFLEHVENALDAIIYGFQVFEQNGYIGKDGFFHLKKLAPRPVQTINEIKIADDGGVKYIKQHFADAEPIPIDQLVFYSFNKRAANWHGRSLLRGCYGPWLLKDRVMRVAAMNIQRSGVGTPIAEGAPGMSTPELQLLDQMMQRMVAGDRSGGAVPFGSKVRMVGVEGSQPDSVGYLKLLNEEMARSFFQMFMQLGQTTSGSRALGQTFVEYHKLVIEYIVNWFCLIFNEHVIEDDIEWNYGPDEEYAPLLCWGWDDQGSDQNPEGPDAAENPSSQYDKLTEEGRLVLPDDIRDQLPRSSSGQRGPHRTERREQTLELPPTPDPASISSNGTGA